MKNFPLLFLLLLLAFNELFSQDLPGKRIIAEAVTSVNGQAFFLETICDEDVIKIRIKVRDSILTEKLLSDSTYKGSIHYIQKLRGFDVANDTLKYHLAKMESARIANSVYSADSVNISSGQFPTYGKLLRKLFGSSPVALDSRESNTNRIVLDGTSIAFTLYQNDSVQIVAHAQSPTKASHPLLFDYINATLGIYREIKKNTFITKERTSGY
jgi:hypothetical protein